MALAFAAWQAALWSHARTEARVVARDAAAQVARSGGGADAAAGSVAAVLSADTDLEDIKVDVSRSNTVVTVRVDASAPGMLIGTSRDISVTVALPIEEITAP